MTEQARRSRIWASGLVTRGSYIGIDEAFERLLALLEIPVGKGMDLGDRFLKADPNA